MVRKQLYITEAQDAQLKRLATTLGVTEAEVMRRSIELFAKTQQPVQYTVEKRIGEVAQMERSLSDQLGWGRADLYRDYSRALDDAAWDEELAFMEERSRSLRQGGSTAKWRRVDSYDNRRSRLPY